LGFAAAFVGVISAVGLSFANVTLGVLSFVTITAATAGFLFFRRRQHVDATITPLLSSSKLRIGANTLTIHLASGLARDYFGENSINPTRVSRMYAKNPETLITVYDEQGCIDGYVDYFPLAPEVGVKLADGSIDEREILESAILAFPDWRKLGSGRHIYLAGVVVDEESPHERGQRLQMLIWSVATILRELGFDGPNDRFCAIATAYSDSGARLLEKLGFSDANTQNKLGKVYMREVGPSDVDNLLQSLPDYGRFAERVGADTYVSKLESAVAAAMKC
jgi:hypothetical protein